MGKWANSSDVGNRGSISECSLSLHTPQTNHTAAPAKTTIKASLCMTIDFFLMAFSPPPLEAVMGNARRARAHARYLVRSNDPKSERPI